MDILGVAKEIGTGLQSYWHFQVLLLIWAHWKAFYAPQDFFYSFSIKIHIYHPLTPHKQVGKVNIKLYMIRSDNILCHIKEACPFWPFSLGKSIFRHYFSLKNSNLISKYFTALSNPILASFFFRLSPFRHYEPFLRDGWTIYECFWF